MPNRTRPRRGSKLYWPRKRAKRIYPTMTYYASSKETKPLGFACWKAAMTHIMAVDNNSNSPTYNKTVSLPVTILDAPPLFVCAVRFYSSSPRKAVGEKWADNLPKKLQKNQKGSEKESDDVSLVVCTQPEKSGMRHKTPEVFELHLGGEASKKREYALSTLGKEIGLKDVFKAGEFADVFAVTKGKGYQGPVKRFGIRIQTRKDKQMHRHVGSIGGVVPRKVDWRNPAAGQLGFFRRSEANKRIIELGDDPARVTPKGGFLGYGLIHGTYLMVEGSVPGPRKRLVMFRKGVRAKGTIPIEVKSVSTASKQGV